MNSTRQISQPIPQTSFLNCHQQYFRISYKYRLPSYESWSKSSLTWCSRKDHRLSIEWKDLKIRMALVGTARIRWDSHEVRFFGPSGKAEMVIRILVAYRTRRSNGSRSNCGRCSRLDCGAAAKQTSIVWVPGANMTQSQSI